MITALFLGLAAGSFIGVLSYRIPKNESIIFPGSRCENCMSPIPLYNNIPVISFLIQKGKCRNCGAKIKNLYFILEILTPVLFVILYCFHGFSIVFFYKALSFSVLLAASAVDIETHSIPDEFYITLLFAGFIYSGFWGSPEKWFLGMASYVFPVLLLYFFSDFITKEIIGFGDIKLMSAVGGFLSYSGLRNLLYFYEVLYISAGFFSLILIFFKKRKLESYIAFAPFIFFSVFINELLL